MQLRPRVAGTGETASSKTNGVQAKVATIFLHHRVRGKFGDAEQRVFGLVDRHLFVDAMFKVGMATVDFPA